MANTITITCFLHILILVSVQWTRIEALSCASSATSSKSTATDKPVHTLILCRHGDSIWNGGEPGCLETFTGWTDVPLSQKGIVEAKNTGLQVSAYNLGIDACFTSILQRAQLTAHYCLWAFSEKPCGMEPRKYISDHRLNERHYGALQGYVKRDVEAGKYGHNPDEVQLWRRSWHTVPPLLSDNDPRRVAELQRFANYCGGSEEVPRGESLEQVARNRIEPFLRDIVTPILDESAKVTGSGTGLVVAHANSLRALIGVICEAESDPKALAKLESLRIQTGVPLVLKYVQRSDMSYQVCDLNCVPYDVKKRGKTSVSLSLDLPVWPLSSIPLKVNNDSNDGDKNTIAHSISNSIGENIPDKVRSKELMISSPVSSY